MDDPMSRGMPFEVGEDLWRESVFFNQSTENSIFGALESHLGTLEPLKNDSGHFDLCVDLPEIDDHYTALEPPPVNENDNHVERPPPSLSADADCWDVHFDQSTEACTPALCSWEKFMGVYEDGAERTRYLSEEGPLVFDAALRSMEKSTGMDTGVLPHEFTLKALGSLALGRSSSLFEWDSSEGKFKITLEGATITGTSLLCSSSLVEEVAHVGSMTMRLRSFVDSSRASKTCPAAMALRSCVARVVDTVEERISGCLGAVKSPLQLLQLVAQPGNLLKLLITICDRTMTLRTDETIIAGLSDLVYELAESETRFCVILQTLLARVSMPWLEMLSADLGLRATGERQTLETAPGISADEHAFLDVNDDHLVRATKHAVAVLREQSPNHPLVTHDKTSAATRFADLSVDIARAHEVAKQYELQMTRTILGTSSIQAAPTATVNSSLDGTWFSDPFQGDHIAGLVTQMSLDPRSSDPGESDRLRHDAMHALTTEDEPTTLQALGRSVEYSPIANLRPLVRVQHKLVNGVLVRQLLRKHDLRLHLERQRSFQLLGNGTFVARLSRALFDKEIQSAERKRGVVPTADEMGLRVGATKDQRWPPASSELQLTLMGLLAEDTNHGASPQTDPTVRQSHLSFAIRELPEEEIERVLDPHSIHALDFLKIDYTTHAPLDAVITPSSLSQYDGVFRYLLKLLRLLHVTASFPRTVPGSRCESAPCSTLAFAQRARDFIVVLVGHVMSVGINAPWQTFNAALHSLEQDLSAEDERSEFGSRATIGVESLRQLHESCLDRIRTRLFLKRKQEKLRAGVEDVLISILQCATTMQSEGTALVRADDLQNFHAKLSHFLKLLADAVEKPPKTVSAVDAEDLDMVRILLARLDWNSYYTAQGK